ncbi:MAG: sugar ABC transporter permease [Anaerolineales bacterium]|nr:sugar ABC transporter permease [Anaerolineales bacterium]
MATITNGLPPSEIKEGSGLSRWLRRTAYTRAAYVYLIPAFLIMAVITFYPMFYQVWMSFTDFGIANITGKVAPNPVGFDNYVGILPKVIKFFGAEISIAKGGVLAAKIPNFSFFRILAFNLVWVIFNVPIHVILGILVALVLNTPGLWGKKIYRAIYVFPTVLPWLVVATIWRNMFDQDYGSINMSLAWIGNLFNIPAEAFRIRWMEDIYPPFQWFLPGLPLPLAFFAMLVTNIWMGWPFNCIVATGALQSIPKDLYEAASIDGANGFQQFWSITAPLLRPAMIPAAMVGMIITFNLFNCIYFMSGGGPLRQTEILVTTAYNLVNAQRLYGAAAAFCVLIFFILFALTLITNRITRATERYDV